MKMCYDSKATESSECLAPSNNLNKYIHYSFVFNGKFLFENTENAIYPNKYWYYNASNILINVNFAAFAFIKMLLLHLYVCQSGSCNSYKSFDIVQSIRDCVLFIQGAVCVLK